MKQLNQCYVQRLNRSTGRTGTLWEGRFHSCLVDSAHYALACYRYIELNPVRAGMTAHPGEYRWSSYRGNAQGSPDLLLSAHPAFLALHEAIEQRQTAYRGLFDSTVDQAATDELRKATRGGYRVGEERRPRGRPARK